MSLDEVKKRFVEEVKLRAFDDRYVDKAEEREILQLALQQGVSVDSARAALAQVCDSEDYILESKVQDELKDLLDTLAGNDGKVDEKEYKDAVAMGMKRTKGKRTEVQCKKMVLEIILDNSYKTSKGMFSNWLAREKKALNM